MYLQNQFFPTNLTIIVLSKIEHYFPIYLRTGAAIYNMKNFTAARVITIVILYHHDVNKGCYTDKDWGSLVILLLYRLSSPGPCLTLLRHSRSCQDQTQV